MPLDARAAARTMDLSRARPGARAASRDLAHWMAEAMAEMTPAPAQIVQGDDGWTPARVGEALVEALKWAAHAAGRTGPAGYGGMRLPDTYLSDDEFAAAGWGLRESADDPADAPPLRVQLSARQVSRHMAALEWPATYLCPAHTGSARMLGLWAACKAYKRPFSKAIDGRGVSRPAAYALRDRGLSLISQGLARNAVPVETE